MSAPVVADGAAHRVGFRFAVRLDGACLTTFSVAGPLLAVAGGGRLNLPSTLDAGTVLAVLASLGLAATVKELTGRDRAVLVIGALSWLALDGRLVAVGLTAAGLLSLRRSSRVPARLASLWLAVAIHVLWAPLAFRFVGRWVIALEMHLIGDAARRLVPDVQVVGARIYAASGWYIDVLEACSAFAGLSATGLVWLATLHLVGSAPTLRAARGLAVGLAGVVAVNVARILLMLPSAEAHAYWHAGDGSTMAVAAGIALGAVPAIVTGARP